MKERAANKDIYVSDLSYEATEEDVAKLFALCGTVRSVHMLLTPQGQSRGIAFVRMSNDKETREAITMLDGTRLIDRCIKVSAAKSKEERTEAVEIPVSNARRRRPPSGRKKSR